ncbi:MULTISPECIES: hypothetical protein [Serratia]|uniref:hypothetical protein n=1 Tax=Serratia TaxID=613 RepID=UPI0002AF2407|nr:hypothetical protein [Serratia marcescens]AGE18457.1 hypothetical protein SMWW4_v1c26620 [Serratia marcescens WW4]BEO51633.1 hypothetical protein SMQE21_15730 [Serratia marcescens]
MALKSDFSGLINMYKIIDEAPEVEYGYYDEPHHSGLNMATLARIHEEGWNGLPARNFMFSAGVAARKSQQKQIRLFIQSAANGKRNIKALQEAGNIGVRTIKETIQNGNFSNPINAPDTAAIKGHNHALIEQGELMEGAKVKLIGKTDK